MEQIDLSEIQELLDDILGGTVDFQQLVEQGTSGQSILSWGGILHDFGTIFLQELVMQKRLWVHVLLLAVASAVLLHFAEVFKNRSVSQISFAMIYMSNNSNISDIFSDLFHNLYYAFLFCVIYMFYLSMLTLYPDADGIIRLSCHDLSIKSCKPIFKPLQYSTSVWFIQVFYEFSCGFRKFFMPVLLLKKEEMRGI